MIGELIRGHAEGVNIPYYSVPKEIVKEEETFNQPEPGTEVAEESMYFEPQRREYLNLIHLMNEQATNILSKAPEDMKEHELHYIAEIIAINHQAFTAGLYRKVTL